MSNRIHIYYKTLEFSDDFIKSIVRRDDLIKVGKVDLTKLKGKTGRYITYKRLFQLFYSKKLNKTEEYIHAIITYKIYNGAIHHSER